MGRSRILVVVVVGALVAGACGDSSEGGGTSTDSVVEPVTTSSPATTAVATTTASPPFTTKPPTRDIVIDDDLQLVLDHGRNGEWDGRHTTPGAVVVDDGRLHLFRNGYQGWPQPSQVGYAVSVDGFTWLEDDRDPVFLHEDIPFDVDLALLTSAMVLDDGTWAFYFTLFPGDGGPSGIAVAAASSPTGEWVMSDRLVLEPGVEGEWDSQFVALADVVRAPHGYHMYYAAVLDDEWGIGLATSSDGLSWEKHGAPVLEWSEEWEIYVQDPRVVRTDDRWVLLYSSFNGTFQNQGYGVAVSDDGVTWSKLGDPVVPRSGLRRSPWMPELVYHDGEYLLYLEMDDSGGTGIFAARLPEEVVAQIEG